MAINKNHIGYSLDDEKLNYLTRILIHEMIAGMDAFDPEDIHTFIETHHIDRERLHVQLKKEAIKVNEDSNRKGLGEILPEDLFSNEIRTWLYSEYDRNYEPVKNNEDEWNICEKVSRRLVSPDQWFDGIGEPSWGAAVVMKENRFNYLLTNGDILSDQWYDKCVPFHEGFAIVGRDGREWFIDRQNNSLTGEETFSKCRSFYNGIAFVYDDDNNMRCLYRNGKTSLKHFEHINRFLAGSSFAMQGSELYQIDRHCNRLNGINLKESHATSLKTIHIVGKDFNGVTRFNLMDGDGEVLLPGWPKNLKEDLQYCEGPFYNFETRMLVDNRFGFSVRINGEVNLSPELTSYLKAQPKVSIRKHFLRKKSNNFKR